MNPRLSRLLAADVALRARDVPWLKTSNYSDPRWAKPAFHAPFRNSLPSSSGERRRYERLARRMLFPREP